MSSYKISFRNDLELISIDLISAFRLEFSQEVNYLSGPLYRWLDFRLRYIDPYPRKIILSNKFPVSIPPEPEVGLHLIEKMIIDGKDLNIFQSKGLVRFNDISGNNRSKRTDLLWADWGITHLHLTDKINETSDYFSPRECSCNGSWLLFCIVTDSEIGFIDIRQHKDENIFSDQSLIQIVKRSWPNFMEKFKVNGVGFERTHDTSNNDIRLLRKNGINTPTFIDGVFYFSPNLDLTSASTSMQVTEKADRLIDWVESLASIAEDETSELNVEARNHGASVPSFKQCLFPKGIAILEEKTNIAFTFSKQNNDDSRYSLIMENLLCPKWALNKLNG